MSKKKTPLDLFRDYIWQNYNIAFSENVWREAKEIEKKEIIQIYNEGARDTIELGEKYYYYVYEWATS